MTARARAATAWRARALAGALVTLALGTVAPRAAHACYVCMSGREDETGQAFFLGSVLLSLLPFALFGGIALFVWWRVRASSRAEDARRAAARAEAQARPPAPGRPVHEGGGGA